MACGILNDEVIVRVGPQQYEDSLELPHTRKFDITGRPMKGWVMVSHDGHESDEDLMSWVQKGVNFALSLPPKLSKIGKNKRGSVPQLPHQAGLHATIHLPALQNFSKYATKVSCTLCCRFGYVV